MKAKLSSLLESLGSTLFHIGNQPVTGFSVAASVVVVVATFWISKAVQETIHRGMVRRQSEVDLGTVMGTKRLAHYVVMVLGLSYALHTFGVNLSGLFTAGAIFAVGIGFALQNVTQNFVSGVILLFERSITPKDIVEVEGTVAEVLRMGIRATTVRTRDGEDMIVPNSYLVQNTVKNMTLDDQTCRIKATVGVAYESDQHLVHRVLGEVAKKHHSAHDPSRAQVLMLQFGSSSVDYEVAVWTSDPWRARQKRSELNFAIWDALKAAGITIAFPQMDLHLISDKRAADKSIEGAKPPAPTS